ncbi:MAG: efflux RND transporter periplasmic adaptor subunit [Acidaminococcaceae bacterium]|nr:efflux RND transporter periplasmic adaptor subunit [Acidaminococcaceae bacterium]MBP5735888.1 efflux RND transporter periplasmic adaptor subunit [Acidaminococcaceae bacterium]
MNFLSEIRFTKTHYIIAGLALAAFLGWRTYTVLHPVKSEGRVVPVVRTITVGETVAGESAVYPGEVRGKYESNLAFQAAGKIIARHVNLGDKVGAGQVLMELDPKDIAQSYSAAQAAYQSALSNYQLAKDNYDRYSALYEKNAVSAMARDQYRTQFEAAEATLKSAQAQLNASRNQMDYTQLKADHDGIVASVSGEIGQVVGAGTPVVTVVQDGSREIQIYIPENRLGQIRPNQPAEITFWALNDITASGHISEIAPMADSVTRTYKVKVAVDTMPEQAKLGMTAKVTLQTGSENTITVPSGAIYQTGEQAQVWVIRDKKATLVNVKTAGYEGNNVRIAGGLRNGDIVVTGGVTKLAEGQEVRLEGSERK